MLIERAGCVGREEELVELASRLALTRASGSAAVLVLADPGLGKTALLRGLADRATTTSLKARAGAWEQDSPGAVLRQLLGEAAPADPVAASDLLIARAAAGAGEEPGLVLVDDADLADTRSLQAIASALRRHPDAPVLVVLTATRSTPFLGEIAAETVRIEGLDAAAVGELASLRGRVLHPAMAEVLTRHTAGNPRDAVALLDELPASSWARPDTQLPAPVHVREEVELALAGCGADGCALAEAFAILGEDASLAQAATLAGLEDPLSAVDALVAAGLVRTTSDHRPRWRTPLVGVAVLATMGARRAADAHQRAASIVDDEVRRARHLVAATPLPDAGLADEVARLAQRRGDEGAWAEAAALYRDSSRLTEDPVRRDDRLIRSVDALVAAGDGMGAAALVPIVESLRETPLRDAVLAYLAILRGRATEAEVRLKRAWDIVNADREPETAALIATRHVLHSLALCRGDELVTWADRAISLAGRDSAAGVEAAAIRGLGLAMAGRFEEAHEAYALAARRVGHSAQTQRVTMGRGWLDVLSDEPDEARSRLEGITDPRVLGGSTRISMWALAWLARVQFLTGEGDAALQTVAAGRALADESGIALVTPLLEWTATETHLLRGSWEEAARTARAAEVGAQGYEIMRVPALLARARIAEARSDFRAVLRILEPLAQASAGSALAEPAIWPWAETYAAALIAESRLEEADDFLRPHETRAREEEHRSAQARLATARGRWHGARGDLAGVRDTFDRALGLLDGMPLRYERARITFAYGQALRRAGRRRDAEALLSSARDLWDGLGALTYVDAAQRELRAGGVRAPRGQRGPVDLTPQEETVAEMVASGLSNREVAAQLFVSPKTVQYHLTRIYAKLGVRSRTELAAMAAEPTEEP
ncbi:helix-turn-helix transcriptional regulator [Nocardioides albus]|uniref:DNA-binding CsgD family transcriptional regulator n=1 Tax=Nocardioides albus TaxID=1841 RepID=A0A7W5A2Q1_9ACTN|nr:LuxR family transcriptional regulator [Nocardioides albus]MBB3088618.1 DNA-binding CsgD family transcriptional regulator [Nocardioides albus]